MQRLTHRNAFPKIIPDEVLQHPQNGGSLKHKRLVIPKQYKDHLKHMRAQSKLSQQMESRRFVEILVFWQRNIRLTHEFNKIN
ncbi:hypothetical protein TNIN_27291 [Trichonephila inaurata madagascariensis]|uniref:Uncharacterized protein n=1 Tax=Trichonephila inaurata madagascariensis TaxID=2747483 RepID=A0A8X6Y0B9_9ARAC|nr:hypothetical protein TNIN_27291 [Trichonephila inaurata madagascariensis]